ncbi:MAG: 2OG-Fe(II) oxygenase [Pseudomonadota bacterium]
MMRMDPAARRLRDAIADSSTKGSLLADGCAVLPGVLDFDDCQALRNMYADDALFRSTIAMARHAFGSGEYRYFCDPVAEPVRRLRRSAYGELAPLANVIGAETGAHAAWPATLEALSAQCRAAGQARPTSLMLRYRTGDFNRLHQDRYGDVMFPLQLVFLLSEPEVDFEGGSFVMTESRPRMQSRTIVSPLRMGDAALFFGAERRVRSTRGWATAQMRHGVDKVRSGERYALGVIFHDAP